MLRPAFHSRPCARTFLSHPLHSIFFKDPRCRSIFEQLEKRGYLSATVFRSIDGTGNNRANSDWGSAGSDFTRLAPAAYANGVDSPALPNDQSARAISNLLNDQADPNNPGLDLATVDKRSLSDYGYLFGQFMDHDMDLTPDGGASFPIPVAPGDPIGPGDLPFTRSQTDPNTGTGVDNPAQQFNINTSYLDLSQVYGSSKVVSDALRTLRDGLLKTSPGNMLPYNNATYFTSAQISALSMANDSHIVDNSQLFAAGDRRANENIELTAIQTLFLRNHNRIATALHKSHPSWSDEQLFQEARKLNIASYQNIVYNGYLPALMGNTALRSYRGYNPRVDATISNEFATVAFRFGHSLLSGSVDRQNDDSTPIADVSPDGSELTLVQAFFDPNLINTTGATDPLTGHSSSDIGPILKSLASEVANASDLKGISDVRNLLFGNGAGGQDLMARDIQRDRDNGIPDYNTLRAAVGLPKVFTFAQITRDVAVQKALAAAYPGGVNTIDAFEGGLAEDHVSGSDFGPLFQRILSDQFSRLRDGDRYFYLNESFNREETGLIQSGNTLTEVIKGNTPLTNLQANAFVFHASIGGTVSNRGRAGFRSPNPVLSGATVRLMDGEGNIVATTRTDSRGNYLFTEQSGPSTNADEASGVSETGTYKVILLLRNGQTQTSSPLAVTRGDTNLDADFTV